MAKIPTDEEVFAMLQSMIDLTLALNPDDPAALRAQSELALLRAKFIDLDDKLEEAKSNVQNECETVPREGNHPDPGNL